MLKFTEATRIRVAIPEKGSYALNDIQEHTGEAKFPIFIRRLFWTANINHWERCFNGVRVTRSLVLYVCFVDRCFSFCTFSFGHCVVCSSSIYGL